MCFARVAVSVALFVLLGCIGEGMERRQANPTPGPCGPPPSQEGGKNKAPFLGGEGGKTKPPSWVGEGAKTKPPS